MVDLVEAEEIEERWKEYTEELYKKDLHEPDNHDGVVSHPEPDILERDVSGPQEAQLSRKVVDAMELQQSHLKP